MTSGFSKMVNGMMIVLPDKGDRLISTEFLGTNLISSVASRSLMTSKVKVNIGNA